MTTPFRRSIRASAFAALVLTVSGLAFVVAASALTEGFTSSTDLGGEVWQGLLFNGIYFVVALVGWLLGVAPELPPYSSRIRGVLVAGFGIPMLDSLVIGILDATGVLNRHHNPSTTDDGWMGLIPVLVFMVFSGGVGYWLIRRGDRTRSRVAAG